MRLSTRRSSPTICTGLNAFQTRIWSTCSLTRFALEYTPFLSRLQTLLVGCNPCCANHSIDNFRSKLTNSNRPRSSHHRWIILRLPDGRFHHPGISRKRSRKVVDGMHQRDAQFMAESEGRVALYWWSWWRACSKVLWEGVWDEEVRSWNRRIRDHD